MSSIMRRRSGLMAISVIGGSCLEDEVANSSILKTGRRPHHHPFTSRRSSRALPCAQRPPARAGSFFGTLPTLGECPHGVGKQPFAAQLYATFAAFYRPNTDSGRRTRLGFLCGREAGRLVRHESRRQAMARVAGHLSVDDLEAGFRSARDPTATRHVQVIWLFARGHTIADVAAVTSFVPRWIEQLLARYNAK